MMPTKLWNSFTAAPYRVMSFGGALQTVAVMLCWLYVAAAALWLVCFAPWMLRYLPVYVRPRVDGQAG